MLEGSDGDLCVFVDERESLSLVEESELVDSIDVGHLDDLPVTLPPPLRWSSPRPAGRRRRSNSCARRGPASRTPPACRPSTSPPRRNAHSELAPLLAVPLLHQHRVVERVLHAVDHVVPRDLRLPVATGEEPRERLLRGGQVGLLHLLHQQLVLSPHAIRVHLEVLHVPHAQVPRELEAPCVRSLPRSYTATARRRSAGSLASAGRTRC